MTVYHCMIELKSDARALAFAAAVRNWMTWLADRRVIAEWRLMRRTMGLASGPHTDFLLEVEVTGIGALDPLFRAVGQADDEGARRYDQMHQMIARADVGLYRDFPDAQSRERIALI